MGLRSLPDPLWYRLSFVPSQNATQTFSSFVNPALSVEASKGQKQAKETKRRKTK